MLSADRGGDDTAHRVIVPLKALCGRLVPFRHAEPSLINRMACPRADEGQPGSERPAIAFAERMDGIQFADLLSDARGEGGVGKAPPAFHSATIFSNRCSS